MGTFLYILLAAAGVICALCIFGIVSPTPETERDSGFDNKDRAIKKLIMEDYPVDPRKHFYKMTLQAILDRAWEIFDSLPTSDMVEIEYGDIACQITADPTDRKSDGKDVVTVTYVYYNDASVPPFPDYLLEKEEGELYSLRYDYPAQKKRLVSEMQDIMGGIGPDTVVRCFVWHND